MCNRIETVRTINIVAASHGPDYYLIVYPDHVPHLALAAVNRWLHDERLSFDQQDAEKLSGDIIDRVPTPFLT